MQTPQAHDNAERQLRQLEAIARHNAAWRQIRYGSLVHGSAERRGLAHDGVLVVHWGDLPDEETGEIGLGLRFRYVKRYGEYPGTIISREAAMEILAEKGETTA